ncbi:hypothetical protein L1987_31133 [Smallanthus sonchifolius]|uniref:Uncharacterized protein n=1 Tax=Smallanthus sonchifolius TaxID=185202 RepID=A0ACB9I5F7_9ASTR|nr:hypothetical protein L1987_31133 [Smallanthus sonchifolius]
MWTKAGHRIRFPGISAATMTVLRRGVDALTDDERYSPMRMVIALNVPSSVGKGGMSSNRGGLTKYTRIPFLKEIKYLLDGTLSAIAILIGEYLSSLVKASISLQKKVFKKSYSILNTVMLAANMPENRIRWAALVHIENTVRIALRLNEKLHLVGLWRSMLVFCFLDSKLVDRAGHKIGLSNIPTVQLMLRRGYRKRSQPLS